MRISWLEGGLAVAAGALAYAGSGGGGRAAVFALLAAGAAFGAAAVARRRARGIERSVTEFGRALEGGQARYSPPEGERADEMATALNTAARAVAARIKEAEAQGGRFSAVMDEISEGVVCVSPEGTVTAANGSAREMLSAGEIEGKNYWEAVLNPELRGIIGDALEGKGRIRREVENIYPSENFYAACAVRLEGGEAALILADKTGIKHLTEANRALVTNMSHEIRTPLTSIMGAAEVIAGRTGDGETAKMASLLVRNSRRLADLCARIIRLTETDERGAAETAPFDLAEAARAAAASVAEEAEKNGVRIEVEAERGLITDGDRLMVENALVNLIENAVKYSPGGGSVRVRADAAGVAVSDEGAGVPDGEREKIFERFYRGSAARGKEGSGLGLSIARQTAAVHGGNITVESGPGGRGSVFAISFGSVRSA